MISSPKSKSDMEYNDMMKKLESHIVQKESNNKSSNKDKGQYQIKYDAKI